MTEPCRDSLALGWWPASAEIKAPLYCYNTIQLSIYIALWQNKSLHENALRYILSHSTIDLEGVQILILNWSKEVHLRTQLERLFHSILYIGTIAKLQICANWAYSRKKKRKKRRKRRKKKRRRRKNKRRRRRKRKRKKKKWKNFCPSPCCSDLYNWADRQ